jgi:Arc/MetJ-type ribon-helix-helix transcriptional regulator
MRRVDQLGCDIPHDGLDREGTHRHRVARSAGVVSEIWLAMTEPSVPRRPSSFRGAATLCDGMVDGMATKKVTITLEAAQLDRVRELVEAGKASSVSGFVQHAVGVSLDDIAGWGALLAQALRDTGGPLSRDEKAWADEMLGNQKRRTRSVA